MKTTAEQIRYEDAAHVVTVTGWACKRCQRFYGNGPHDEHAARWCCATDLPCQCGGRNRRKGYTVCEACQEKSESERWAALPRVQWDGKTPLATWDNDRYFFGPEDVLYWMDKHDLKPEDMRLVLCEPCDPPTFEMNEFLCDVLPPDGREDLDYATIDKAVNDWIAAQMPISWFPTNKAISVESLPMREE